MSTGGKTYTICDIASEAGVSKSTVSRVINNCATAKPATVIKVREAMKQLGYESGPAKARQGHRQKRRRPTTYRTLQIALISQTKPFLLEAPVYAKVLRGIEEELGRHNVSMIVRNLTGDRPWEQIPRKIDGAILFNLITPADSKLLQTMRQMPCVRIMGPPPKNDFFDHVTYKRHLVGSLAADYLLEKGHRKLLTLSSPDHEHAQNFTIRAEAAGATVTACEHSDLIDESRNTRSPNIEKLYHVTRSLKALPDRPTGFFATDDVITIGLYQVLPRHDIIPGKDVDLIGVNNDAVFLNHLSPRPASVDIHSKRIGIEAVRQLFWRRENPKEPLIIKEIEPDVALH